jgi:hypothetical protein
MFLPLTVQYISLRRFVLRDTLVIGERTVGCGLRERRGMELSENSSRVHFIRSIKSRYVPCSTFANLLRYNLKLRTLCSSEAAAQMTARLSGATDKESIFNFPQIELPLTLPPYRTGQCPDLEDLLLTTVWGLARLNLKPR